jgi:hypothetical protein
MNRCAQTTVGLHAPTVRLTTELRIFADSRGILRGGGGRQASTACR